MKARVPGILIAKSQLCSPRRRISLRIVRPKPMLKALVLFHASDEIAVVDDEARNRAKHSPGLVEKDIAIKPVKSLGQGHQIKTGVCEGQTIGTGDKIIDPIESW